MNCREDAIIIDCHGDRLVGILAVPDRPTSDAGVLVVVGGPQYRVGSHRQFVELSHSLAESGIPCLRFDFRGMGDSEGAQRNFSDVNDDIAAAVDAFLSHCPKLSSIVLWGLCDGATAAAFYAASDSRITGLIMLNPWLHTERTKAQTYIKHYYVGRFFSSAFWLKILNGEFDPRRAVKGAAQLLRSALLTKESSADNEFPDDQPLPQRLYNRLIQRPIPTLIMLSGNDLVAREFDTITSTDANWSHYIQSVQIQRIQSADHTFSDPVDKDRATRHTIDWINSL